MIEVHDIDGNLVDVEIRIHNKTGITIGPFEEEVTLGYLVVRLWDDMPPLKLSLHELVMNANETFYNPHFISDA